MLTGGAVLLAASLPGDTAVEPIRGQADAYEVSAADMPLPEGLSAAIAAHVQDTALTVSSAVEGPLMDLWFAKQLPAGEVAPPDPAVTYGTLSEGVVLAVMRLHRDHRDFRDQSVPAGTYVVRYLRQPDDGNHLGETTYRDFAVLVPATARTAGPQRFDVTLGQALQLNTHPFVWGLWPAVTPATEPGIAPVDDDKWALELTIPREDGDSLKLALVFEGNERHYD